ncbi:MAG: hypothetical protein JSS76_20085 [Bacteroidetes bacterium]|nr:hypothetical protein [Bacteroidota bacterium]
MRNVSITITDACVTTFKVSHNGLQGGDASHGGFVEIEIDNVSSTNLKVAVKQVFDTNPDYKECTGVKLKFAGDAERNNLIEGLELILHELKKNQ